MADLLLAETPKLACAGGQILGARADQQDVFRAAPWGKRGLVLALADGMGGHEGGAMAADLAVNAGVDSLLGALGKDIPADMDAAMTAANEAIGEAKESEPRLRDMGTTLVLVVALRRQVWWASVGDSPLWQIRDNAMRRLNRDHSMAPVLSELVRSGELAAEEAARDPRRGQLRSALTGAPIPMLDLSDVPASLHPGDDLVLASDGLLTLPVSDMADLVRARESPSEAVQALLDAVSARGEPNQDNTSALVCHRIRKNWLPRLFRRQSSAAR
jgi:serine/threonine protein phosphatase PrpC